MARPPLQTLSPVHARIAGALAAFARQGRPAFLPELVRVLNLARQSSLSRSLEVMTRNGYIEIHGHEPGQGSQSGPGMPPGAVSGGKRRTRVVQLTAKGRHAAGLGGLPLLGSIPAGLLAESVAQPEATVEPDALLPWRPGDFLLRVRGESMTGDGILDGDLVLLRPAPDLSIPGSGVIAAACVGDEREATLKRVFREGDRIRLRASHPAYPDVVVPAGEVFIAGVFKGLIRHGGNTF